MATDPYSPPSDENRIVSSQFSIRFLLTVTTIIAILSYGVAFLSQTTYLISIVPVPLAIAHTCRYSLNRNHECSSFVGLVSAVLIGATMMAWSCYNQTFNKGAVGFLFGGGWSSVVASAIVGAFFGMYGGVVSTLLYLIVTATIGRLDSNLTNQNAG